MVVALIALFVSLSGTAMAAKPVARALFANNAGKLQGKTLAQVVAQSAAVPSPAQSARGLVSVASREFFAAAGESTTESVSCTSGRAISAYVTTTGGGKAVPSNITSTAEATWSIEISNLRTDGPARGTVSVVCLS
jgi:hypothetical protein